MAWELEHSCNVYFYDDSTANCFLGTIGMSFNVITGSIQSMHGYVSIGKAFFLPPTGKSTLRIFGNKSSVILGNGTGLSLLRR
jgi:hypothetical protein